MCKYDKINNIYKYLWSFIYKHTHSDTVLYVIQMCRAQSLQMSDHCQKLIFYFGRFALCQKYLTHHSYTNLFKTNAYQNVSFVMLGKIGFLDCFLLVERKINVCHFSQLFLELIVFMSENTSLPQQFYFLLCSEKTRCSFWS